jgi:hypothetical protein
MEQMELYGEKIERMVRRWKLDQEISKMLGVEDAYEQVIKETYRQMSDGGDGGEIWPPPKDWTGPNSPTIRGYYWPGASDEVFRKICRELGWSE